MTLALAASTDGLGDPATLDLSALVKATTATIDIGASNLSAAHLNTALDKVIAFVDAVIGDTSPMTALTLTVNAASTPANVNLSDSDTDTKIATIAGKTITGATINYNPVVTGTCVLD